MTSLIVLPFDLIESGGYILVDRKSVNGVMIDDVRLSPESQQRLQDGCEVTFGQRASGTKQLDAACHDDSFPISLQEVIRCSSCNMRFTTSRSRIKLQAIWRAQTNSMNE